MEGEAAMTIEPVQPLTTAVLNAALAEVQMLKAENDTLRHGWDERAAKLQEENAKLREEVYQLRAARGPDWPCAFEPRAYAEGPGRAWCRTHGYDCPQMRPR